MLQVRSLVATLLLRCLRQARWPPDARPELAFAELAELGRGAEALDAWLDHFCVDDDDDAHAHHDNIARAAFSAGHPLAPAKVLARLTALWPEGAPPPPGWRVLLDLLRAFERSGWRDARYWAWMERARAVDVAFWVRGVPDDPRAVDVLHAIVDARADAVAAGGADCCVVVEALSVLRTLRALTPSERALLRAATQAAHARRRRGDSQPGLLTRSAPVIDRRRGG